jgi:hypothetical protein
VTGVSRGDLLRSDEHFVAACDGLPLRGKPISRDRFRHPSITELVIASASRDPGRQRSRAVLCHASDRPGPDPLPCPDAPLRPAARGLPMRGTRVCHGFRFHPDRTAQLACASAWFRRRRSGARRRSRRWCIRPLRGADVDRRAGAGHGYMGRSPDLHVVRGPCSRRRGGSGDDRTGPAPAPFTR